MSGYRRRSAQGFTLVELLVVITIIGMLMALLLPAVNAAVEAFRALACRNKQVQLAIGANLFEHSKSRYPGYFNKVPNKSNGKPAGWIVAILGNIGRQDILDVWQDTSIPVNDARLKKYDSLFICDSDPPETTGGSANAYVINAGYYLTSNEKPANGIAHNYGLRGTYTNKDTLIEGDGPEHTLLISENVVAGNYELYDKIQNVFVFHPNDANQQRRINGKLATDQSLANVTLSINSARPSSFHSGGVNVVFCGQNAIFLREDIDYKVYMQLMTPNGNESDMPAIYKKGGSQWYVLDESDYK